MLCQSSDWSEVTVSPNAPPLTTRVVKGTKPSVKSTGLTEGQPNSHPSTHHDIGVHEHDVPPQRQCVQYVLDLGESNHVEAKRMERQRLVAQRHVVVKDTPAAMHMNMGATVLLTQCFDNNK